MWVSTVNTLSSDKFLNESEHYLNKAIQKSETELEWQLGRYRRRILQVKLTEWPKQYMTERWGAIDTVNISVYTRYVSSQTLHSIFPPPTPLTQHPLNSSNLFK